MGAHHVAVSSHVMLPIVFDDDEDDFSLLATWVDEERGMLWMAETRDMCCWCTCCAYLLSSCIWAQTQNSSQDSADPDALAAALSQSTIWDSVKLSCGGNPTLLGTCTFNPNTRTPVPSALKLWNLGEGASTFSFVLYRPHPPQSLRFYIIEPTEYPSAPSNAPPLPDFYHELARYDFTRPEGRNVDQALNDIVIDQVRFPMSLPAASHNLFLSQINASFLVQTIINSGPRKSVKLLPTTASFLLTIASYLGGFFSFFLVLSKIAAVFMNLPLLPIPTWIGGTSKTSYLKLKDISTTG